MWRKKKRQSKSVPPLSSFRELMFGERLRKVHGKSSPEEQSLNLAAVASEYVRKNVTDAKLNEFKTKTEYDDELLAMEFLKLERHFRSRWATLLASTRTIFNQYTGTYSRKELLKCLLCFLKQKLEENMLFDAICPPSIKVRKGKAEATAKTSIKKPLVFLKEETKTAKDKTYLKFPYRIFEPIHNPPFSIPEAPITCIPEIKTFIVMGPYDDVKSALVKRGWVENLEPESLDFTLKWTLKTKDLAYDVLKPGQMVNHFQKATEITTKVGLFHSLQNFAWAHGGLDIDSFHPLTYDLADIEIADFVQEFKASKAESVLKSYLAKKSVKEIGLGKLIISMAITERRMWKIADLIRTTVVIGDKLVTDQEWEILTCHKTVETKLLREKYPALQKRINSLFARYKGEYPLSKTADEALVKKVNDLLRQLQQKYPQSSISGTQNVWIVKPAGLSRGRGITMLSDLKRILEFPKGKHYIIQKYIENPLIVCNRKFDIRQWVLITSWNPLVLWMYGEMYVRFGAENYSTDTISSKFVHLTNNSVTKHYIGVEGTIKGNMWSNAQFVEYLKGKYGRDVWNESIKPKIKQIIIISLQSAQEKVVQRENTFEIFGYDFMIDENLNPWLIEVNASPAVDYSTVRFLLKRTINYRK